MTDDLRTTRRACAQFVVCRGCCCGTDRYPPVPFDRIKTAWKTHHLNSTIQLTVSGCLGPCDLANVGQIVSANGTMWLGRLQEEDFDQIIEWARDSRRAGTAVALPAELFRHRFASPFGDQQE